MLIKTRREAVLNLYNVAFGMLLLISPWLMAYANGAARLDAWATGVTLIAASLAALIAFADWEEWLSLLIGVWLIAAPWALGFAHTRAMHFSIGIGAAVSFIAALELWLIHFEPQQTHGGG